MVRMPYTQITREALPPRVSVLGYVKVGGLEDRIRFTQQGKPWVAPVRYVSPVRFEITTREQRVEEVKGTGQLSKETYRIGRGYVRDERIHEKLGSQAPNEIDVRFMFPTWEQNFICHFGAHDGKRWVCQGNGVEAKDVGRGAVPCPCPRLKQFEGAYQGPKPPEQRLVPCRPRGVLSMILPDAETFGGFHVFKTTSYESIANIRTQLEVFEAQFGRLDGLPFRLKVYPATKSYDDGAGTTTQPIVTLVIAASFDTARQLGAAAAEESRRLLMAAGGAPDPEQHRTVLVREMEEEAEAEGREFFPQEDQPGQAGRTPLEEINAKIEARRTGQPLPVVQGEKSGNGNGNGHQDEGPDYEVLDDEEGEQAEDAAEPLVRELQALLDEHGHRIAAPHLARLKEGIQERNEDHLRAGLGWLRGLLGGPGGEPAKEGPSEDPAPETGSDPDPNEPRGSLTGKTRSELSQEYTALLLDARPRWGQAEIRLWQAKHIGRSTSDQWEPDDFELAIQLVRRGKLELGRGAQESAQASMPGV